MKGYIYQLECSFEGCDDFYIGSTTNMKDRKKGHKSDCTNVNSNSYNYKVYKYIRETGGFNNWFMWILEEVEERSRSCNLCGSSCSNKKHAKPRVGFGRVFKTDNTLRTRSTSTPFSSTASPGASGSRSLCCVSRWA